MENQQWRTDHGRYATRGDGPLKALKDHRFEELLSLKIDTLVIILDNVSFDQGLVNGAQGKIVGFQPFSLNGSGVSDSLPEVVGEHKEERDAQVRKFAKTRNVKEWPIVRFSNGLERTIHARCQTVLSG